ncbi:hypothetical protein H4R33_000289 [Dimargaris cristalligena]|uniref:Uncharacterized protein n=1 Tax=Dimargaris cristalligena TaxID=215637 RepID=A0A4Q0A265_9FUNG|nr:hypothetical protein H4R33_000289 [Dimargaris cristalligena]RKP40147.1 hypothetical protein BJ085DRAFT_41513 [Dimargaris cristalligena]|eukprot:RKP40147.1 hypothetical protein BJ085DRAFT_41513 [Dimargaris cristalligena]
MIKPFAPRHTALLTAALRRSTAANVRATSLVPARRTFYLSSDAEGFTGHQPLFSLEALKRGLDEIKIEMSHSADQGSLTSELDQIRRARDMLSSTLRELEGFASSIDMAPAPGSVARDSFGRHRSTEQETEGGRGPVHYVVKGSVEESFSPVFHSPYGTAYSPLENKVSMVVQRMAAEQGHHSKPFASPSASSARSAHPMSYNLEDHLSESSFSSAVRGYLDPLAHEATADAEARPELHVSAEHMLQDVLTQSALDAASDSSSSSTHGYHSYTPTASQHHHAAGGTVSTPMDDYIEVGQSAAELASRWSLEDHARAAEDQFFEPKIAGSEYTTVESLNDYHRSV